MIKTNLVWLKGNQGSFSICLFEDPDGIRIEANHVPGKGNLDANVTLPKDWSDLEEEEC